MMKGLSEQEQQLLYALALMCEQHLGEEHDGRTVLDHMCMSAGEEAYKALAAYGLITTDVRGATWTDAGLVLIDLPFNQQPFVR